MTLSAVLVADTVTAAVDVALHALADAVHAAEAAGDQVEVVIVDASTSSGVADLLRRVEGAVVVRRPGADRWEALLAGSAVASGDVLWWGGTESCAGRASLASLSSGARGVGGLALAAAEQPAPQVAFPAELVAALTLPARAAGGTDPVPVLVSAARSAAVPITTVADAGARRQRVRSARRIDGDPNVFVAPGRFSVGPATYSGPMTLVNAYGPLDEIEIGGYCSIANAVRIVLPGGRFFDGEGRELQLDLRGGHRMDAPATFPVGMLVPDEPYDEPPAGSRGERLVIGDDVWIGFGATVLGDVTVGAGSVVAAGAVVMSDVPPYTVVGGVPAKVLRKRFDEATAARLLRVAWWDWPPEVVAGAHRWFGRSTADFLSHFDPAGALAEPADGAAPQP